MATASGSSRFGWLRERARRRSALAEMERWLRDGWDLDAAGQAELTATLRSLRDAGELSGREVPRVERILLARAGSPAQGAI